LPGLTPQVGFTRLAALLLVRNSGKPEFRCNPAISKKDFAKKMDARVKPAHDESAGRGIRLVIVPGTNL
jgi:hypothetical protein